MILGADGKPARSITQSPSVGKERRLSQDEQSRAMVPRVLVVTGPHGLTHRCDLDLYWLPSEGDRPDCYGIKAHVQMGSQRTEIFHLAILATEMGRLKRDGHTRIGEALRRLLREHIAFASGAVDVVPQTLKAPA
jgi:hypothetical protein